MDILRRDRHTAVGGQYSRKNVKTPERKITGQYPVLPLARMAVNHGILYY